MIVLGLNAFHGDAAASLLIDGQLIAAVEEERLTRIKHQAGFPKHAIEQCLAIAGLAVEDIDHVAINRDPRAALAAKLWYTLRKRPSWALVKNRLRNARAWADVDQAMAEAFPQARIKAQFHHIEHHLAHLASAFDVSPFDQALVLSVDGFGDFASAAWALADEHSMAMKGRISFPHSLGIFYQAMTQYLGFPNYGDEYKIMGLAAYGKPRYQDRVGQLIKTTRSGEYRLDLRYFRHHKENVPYQWDQGAPKAGRLFSDDLVRLLGRPRGEDEPLHQHHKDLAASIQAVYENALFTLVRALAGRFPGRPLCLAGGCAQNSLANGRIRQHTPIEKLYVPSAATDAGGAVGAALACWRRLNGGQRASARLKHGRLGTAFDAEQIDTAIEKRQAELGQADAQAQHLGNDQQLCKRVSELIDQGAVVGWFQGEMEWGPRALGQRSILADPRRGDIRALLNAKIKLREGFRPFAPSVLEEALPVWFELKSPEDADTPFMARVYPVRSNRREQVPAIVHADGTGRLQSVNAQASPLYHQLINAFAKQTGIPMLLNTSFNENEPIVHTPGEALDCFLRTKMDALVMGRCVLLRSSFEPKSVA